MHWALSQHLREKHLEDSKGIDIRKRLAVWLENNFVTQEELDKVAGLPEGLVFPEEMVATPRVRAIVPSIKLENFTKVVILLYISSLQRTVLG